MLKALSFCLWTDSCIKLSFYYLLLILSNYCPFNVLTWYHSANTQTKASCFKSWGKSTARWFTFSFSLSFIQSMSFCRDSWYNVIIQWGCVQNSEVRLCSLLDLQDSKWVDFSYVIFLVIHSQWPFEFHRKVWSASKAPSNLNNQHICQAQAALMLLTQPFTRKLSDNILGYATDYFHRIHVFFFLFLTN